MKINIFKVVLAVIIGFCQIMPISAQTKAQLYKQFGSPSGESLPWCFWYWMYGAVSEEGITADIEAMKQAGLGGCYLMPIYGTDRRPEYEGKAQQLSDEWWKMIGHSVAEADRNGLQLGIHVSDGFALAGGPWIKPEESMQKIVSADTIVSRGKKAIKQIRLPKPESYKGYYEDIKVLAVPVIKTEVLDTMPCQKTYSAGVTLNNGTFRATGSCYIQLEYEKDFTVRSVEITPSVRNMQSLRMTMLASNDGETFTKVKEFVPPRSGWQDSDFSYTFAVPETTARYFRFTWTPEGTEPGSESLDAAKWKPNLKLKNIVLHRRASIDQWQGKSGLVWRIDADKSAKPSHFVQIKDIIDLTASLSADGTLNNPSLPEGCWRIIRIGHTSTGHENATAGGGRGLECDKFSTSAVKKQIDGWFGAIYNHVDKAVARRVITRMHVDSWECGSQNWSSNFADEFKARRGYDLMPYLPVMVGVPVESHEKSEQVLRDVRKTISELIVDVFFKTAKAEAERYNCELSTECVAPTMMSDGLLHYSVSDRPMGEFWLQSPTHDKPNDMLDAISGAHIYGKNIVQAEGFTQLRGHWDETPATVKSLLDCNFSLGINKLFYHVYTHNPWLDRKPGMTLDGIGFYFQRDNTWWTLGAPALSLYAARCQTLLQYGKPVADIAVYTGDELPSRAVLPEKLITLLPGLYGKEKVEAEKARMKNEGQPMDKVNGVGFAKNINRAELWWGALHGYQYDSMNPDVLHNHAKAEDGRLRLASGAEYATLVVDKSNISEETRKKIEELKKNGCNVIDYTLNDSELKNVRPDVVASDSMVWTHRKGEEMDIYFVASISGRKRDVELSFRQTDRMVELWNPMTGKTRNDFATGYKDGRTVVRLTLQPSESLFVVFGQSGRNAETSAEPMVQTEPAVFASEGSLKFSSLPSTTISGSAKDVFFDWSASSDEKIKYYSGTAEYQLKIKRPKTAKGARVYLVLDNLRDVASVKVNNADCGTLWFAPCKVDVTDALQNAKGKTVDVQITVQNTWNNAIKGASVGKAPFDGIWTNANYRSNPFELIPAGLIGGIQWEVQR